MSSEAAAAVHLAKAKAKLGLMQALDKLQEDGVAKEVIDAIEGGVAAWDMVQSMSRLLLSGADESEARNFVTTSIVGIKGPFDRIHIEVMRPGGKTPTELYDEAKQALDAALTLLAHDHSDIVQEFVTHQREKFFPPKKTETSEEKSP